jgi:hypothetical protein
MRFSISMILMSITARHTAERPEDLNPLEVEAYMPYDYKQPQWERRADDLKGTAQQVSTLPNC